MSTPTSDGHLPEEGVIAPPQTPPMAVWAFVLSLLGFLCGIPAIIGMILGFVSLPETQRRGRGRGLAIAAIIISGVWLVIGVTALAVSAVNNAGSNPAAAPSSSTATGATPDVPQDDASPSVSGSEEVAPDESEEPTESESPSDEATTEPSPEATGSVRPSPSPSSPEASPNPTPGPTDSPEPTPSPEPTSDPIRFKGSGDKILKIEKPDSGPALITFTHDGYGNFAVWSLDSELEKLDLLVNAIGDYKGTTVLDRRDGEETARLDISADGDWTVTISPLSSAKRFTEVASGESANVLIYEGPVGVATLKHKGSGNFAVWFYSATTSDLAANEIGSYSGQAVMPKGPTLVVVETKGSWSIQVE